MKKSISWPCFPRKLIVYVEHEKQRLYEGMVTEVRISQNGRMLLQQQNADLTHVSSVACAGCEHWGAGLVYIRAVRRVHL